MSKDGLPDPNLYDVQVDGETREFMKSITGIQDDDELRKHILDIQAEALTVCEHIVWLLALTVGIRLLVTLA